MKDRTTYYIECFYEDGTQILGNGDGQAVMICRNYKRMDAYKRIRQIVALQNTKVHHAKIVTKEPPGKVVEEIRSGKHLPYHSQETEELHKGKPNDKSTDQ